MIENFGTYANDRDLDNLEDLKIVPLWMISFSTRVKKKAFQVGLDPICPSENGAHAWVCGPTYFRLQDPIICIKINIRTKAV